MYSDFFQVSKYLMIYDFFFSIIETKASHIRMALSPVLHFDKKCNDRPNFLVLNILLKNSELFHL